jgi:fermentation-respiration switch protein FrsA (DUF1100 family)
LLAGVILVILASILRMGILERFVFFPDPVLIGTPADIGLGYEEASVATDDGVLLHGWFVPGSRKETLLWFHGNAGNISHRLDNLRLLHDRVGVNVFLFDYRQYGRSTGTASEAGLYTDARAALAYLGKRADVDPTRIVYFGRSLGSAVAIDLATEESPFGLVLETAFVSMREMAGTLLPSQLTILVPAAFDNIGKIARLPAPVLFIHGDRDEIVPYEHGRRLFQAAPRPKAFYTVRGASHNDTYLVGGETYFRHLRDFIDSLPR